jgi:hypothetical protein
MAKIMKSKKDLPEYLDNPSLTPKNLELFIKEKKKFVKNPYKPSEEIEITQQMGTKQIKGQEGWIFAETIEVDQETFIKFYADGLNAIFELSAASLKVFKLVYSQVLNKHNNDKIILAYEELDEKKLINFSRVTFFRGINELLNKEILFKSKVTNQYFINVQYFYNGNRLVQMKQVILKKKEEFEQPDLLEN